MLPIIAGTDTLESADLAAATETWLIHNGMEPEAVKTLKEKLSSSGS